MTLTDKEFQRLRDAARAVMKRIGVETGGANAVLVRPQDGEVRVIEMNRASRDRAPFASKATGYLIAKIATKLAIGLLARRAGERPRGTSAAFGADARLRNREAPRFAFEKFPTPTTSSARR